MTCATCDYQPIGLKPEGWRCGVCDPSTFTPSPRFTVTGVYSGKVYAERLDRTAATTWVDSYRYDGAAVSPLPDLGSLKVGDEWHSHDDARGIKVRRTS